MATREGAPGFGAWVRKRRLQLDEMSGAQLARQVSRLLGSEITRDQIWDLERGVPKSPRPDLVMAIAEVLGRPLPEALQALGYKMPPKINERIDSSLVHVLEGVPLPQQKRLAEILPTFLALAQSAGSRVTYEPSEPELQRVAER
jgi:transcriptional regulator with XRE-family HTH domain